MSNVLSFDRRPAPAPDQGVDDFPQPSTHAAAGADAQARYTRAACALAMACADWSAALLHRSCPGGVELLAKARLLVQDLLLMGGAQPHLHDRSAAPTTRELTTRIRHLKEKAHALGILLQAPRP